MDEQGPSFDAGRQNLFRSVRRLQKEIGITELVLRVRRRAKVGPPSLTPLAKNG